MADKSFSYVLILHVYLKIVPQIQIYLRLLMWADPKAGDETRE